MLRILIVFLICSGVYAEESQKPLQERLSITARQFLIELGEVKRETLKQYVDAKIAERIESEEVLQQVRKDFKDWFENKNPWFPLLPEPFKMNSYRMILAGLNNEKTLVEEANVTGGLEDILNAEVEIPKPTVLEKISSDLLYGSYVDPQISKAVVRQSYNLARVLNALVKDGSKVWFENPDEKLDSVSSLFEKLIESGHSIELIKHTSYANFSSLIFRNKEVIWPVWMRTGVELSNGNHLRIPVSHSEFIWVITGAKVSARVRFFLGTEGASFYPAVEKRPLWTGKKFELIATSNKSKEKILQSVSLTEELYKKLIEDAKWSDKKGLPKHGYGIIGVCNDTTAAIQKGLDVQGVLPFPLLRKKSLDEDAQDSVSLILKSLPKDSEEADQDKKELLERILDVQPDAKAIELLGKAFQEDITVAQKDLSSLKAENPN